MQVAKVRRASGKIACGAVRDNIIHYFPAPTTLGKLFAESEPLRLATALLEASEFSEPLSEVKLLAPVDQQEVWAAGVTYKRSKVAREEESRGAAQFYDKVYSADRPELFLKATPERLIHPGDPVRIRRDGKWNVPEPELALVIAPNLRIVGYTIGNDMSSRDIEGDNPLYLPQAKIYDGSCSVGPFITLAEAMPKLSEVEIHIDIARGGKTVFEGNTSIAQMARSTESLVEWLGKELSFPHGALLLTGTGIVPPDDFTLAVGDIVSIQIGGVGTLINPVAC